MLGFKAGSLNVRDSAQADVDLFWRAISGGAVKGCPARPSRRSPSVISPAETLRDRFRLAACLSRFRPSRARRLAVHCPAAALAAFLALAKRSSGVMYLAAVFPLAPELACNLSYRFLDFSRNPYVHASIEG
jgi:hypothetical protein